MPYTRAKKKQRTKQKMHRKIKENLTQKRQMTARLMAISLKADDYIYKKKPISTREADMYAREMEVFKNQCKDERYLQVIEKLTSYMRCIIREQSPKDIISVNMIDETVELNQLNAGQKYVQNAVTADYTIIIDLEIERSISNLTIVDHKDQAIPETHTYEKKEILDQSTTKVGNTDHKRPELTNTKFVDVNHKDIDNNSNRESPNLLSNFEYENHTNLGSLKNDRVTKNKQTHALENTTTKSIDYVNAKIINKNNNQSHLSNLNIVESKKTDVENDTSGLSQNLLSNFEYRNYLGAVAVLNRNPNDLRIRNGNQITNNIADATNTMPNNSNTNSGNKCTDIDEVIKVNTVKKLGSDTSKSHILSSKNLQPSHANVLPNNITETRYSNTLKTGNGDTISYVSSLNVIQQNKTLGNHSNQQSQNLPSNFEKGNYAAVDVPLNLTNSKNDEINDKVKKRRNTNTTRVKRSRSRKNKVNNETNKQNNLSREPVQNPTNLSSYSIHKNQRTSLKKKRYIDTAWVENIKFVRAKETDEYFKLDDIDESFWTDSSLPSNLSLTDFDYDNINIWKN